MRTIVAFMLVCFLFGLASPTDAQNLKTFVFETTVDATSVGGDPETPLRVVYSFAPDLAPGTGPFGDTPNASGYGPINILVELGSERALGAGEGTGITVFNNAGTTFVEDSYDVRGDFRSFGSARLFGLEIELFRFLLVDSDRTMFANTDLPLTTGFAVETDVAFVDIILRDSFGQAFFVTSSGRPFSLTPLQSTCSSTVTTVDGLRAEVTALQTTRRSKEVLLEVLTRLEEALGAGLFDEARNSMGAFIVRVIHRSTLDETRPGRILVEEANHLVCSASNVLINLPSR